MPSEGHCKSPNMRFLCPKGICLKTECPKSRCLKTVCLKGTMPYDCMPQRDYALWLYASEGICLMTVCPEGRCLLTGCLNTGEPNCRGISWAGQPKFQLRGPSTFSKYSAEPLWKKILRHNCYRNLIESADFYTKLTIRAPSIFYEDRIGKLI